MHRLPPGPRLPGLAQTLWFTFDQLGFWAFCRRRYGRTFTTRLAGFPPIVVTSDGDAIRRLFTGDALLRRHGNDFLKPIFGERSLFFLEPAEHVARRRIELGPFHGAAVRAYTERIAELAEAEVATWMPGEVVASHPRARSLTLKVILELVLGVRDAALAGEITSIRIRDDPTLNERSDVLSLLVRAQDEHGAKLSDADLRDDLVTLVVAGHEPTATALAWACDLLARNPDVSARIRESVASGDREYLKAAVKEVLRARPPLPASASRHALEPFPIGDWIVEPDALIFVDAIGMHSNSEVHAEPEAFRPERFLDDPPDSYAHIPFGGGAHRCLGAALATLELEVFLEALVSRVEVAPAGPPVRPSRRGPTVGPGRDGRVRVARVARLPTARRTAERQAAAVGGLRSTDVERSAASR